MTNHVVRFARVKASRIQRRLVRNPNYGGEGIGLHGWCSVPVEPARRKPKFFEELRKSVRREGFRNPVIVYALPSGLYLSFGCSRLRVAQELDLEIPCIINDFTGEFSGDPEVTSENWEEFFTDVPKNGRFDERGYFTYHYSLERARRHSADDAGFAWTDGDDTDTGFIADEFPWYGR